jgi:hypothetical protein
MAVLFVSHSSKDDAKASSLEAWLRINGFNDVFVDHHSIAGGDAWRTALQKAAGACRAVLCLATANWLASKQCLAEFDAAFYMGKRVIPLLLLPAGHELDADAKLQLSRVGAHYQGINILSCLKSDGHLDLAADSEVQQRLKASLREAGALAEVGFDPEAFVVNRALRPTPFPGLSSFGDDDADAAIFFGRTLEIAETQEALRQMRATGRRQPFMILGASGAGKSSLLLAGIIPRLRRESPAWLPLRAFRPGADPLLNFAESLARTLADFGKPEAHGDIRDRLLQAWSEVKCQAHKQTSRLALETALAAEGQRLFNAAGRSTPSILIPIDQAEELARAEGASADALADYLRVALAAEMRWQLVFTTRTDGFAELQSHPRFRELARISHTNHP